MGKSSNYWVIELIEHDGNNKHCGSMSLMGIWRYIGRVMRIYTQ